MTKTKTQILTETRTLLWLRTRETRSGWCDECGAEVVWLDPKAATVFLDIAQSPERLVMHLSGNRVCSQALLRHMNTTGGKS